MANASGRVSDILNGALPRSPADSADDVISNALRRSA
jgi:hypothetical protein